MPIKLNVFNPSNYPRAGYVEVPWQSIHEHAGINAENAVLVGSKDNVLPHQVNQVDPSDPSRDSLIFLLKETIPPGPENYSEASSFVYIKSDASQKKNELDSELGLEKHIGADGQCRGITIRNRRLNGFFNLLPFIDYKEKNWYAGAFTSMLLDGREILDFGADFGLHDPEKRCMQVSHINLSSAPWEDDSHLQIDMFDKKYIISSTVCGPLRVSFTATSEPFKYYFSNPVTNKKNHFLCKFYREISLYANADYLIEDLCIKGIPEENKDSEQPVNFYFTANYFNYLTLGFSPRIYRFPNVPDWFAIGAPELPPFPGYGFATDMHATEVVNPPPDYPLLSCSHNSFSWATLPGKNTKCLHLFMQQDPFNFDSRTGHHWYEFLFKPLRAGL